MIAARQNKNLIRINYVIGMETVWVTHRYMKYYTSMIGPCLKHTMMYSRNNHC